MRVAASWRGGWGVVVALALAYVIAPAPALAHGALEAPSLEVEWNGPPECPPDAFTVALDHLLAGSAVTDPMRVTATVAPTADGWSIHTDLDAGPGRSGRRTFEAQSCRTAAQAAALALAIAVDPSVLERVVTPAEGPAAEPDVRVPEIPEPELEPVIEPTTDTNASPAIGPIVAAEPVVAADRDGAEPSSQWRGLLGVAGLVDGGALPGVGGGLAGVVGLMHRRFRGELSGTYRFATRRTAALDPRVGGELWQWSVGVRGCGVPRVGTVELPICAGFEGGQTLGRGVGLRVPATTAQPWLAVLAEAGVAWPVRSWLALTARASLALPLLRQDFVIAGLGPVHRVGPVQGRGLFGVELRLP